MKRLRLEKGIPPALILFLLLASSISADAQEPLQGDSLTSAEEVDLNSLLDVEESEAAEYLESTLYGPQGKYRIQTAPRIKRFILRGRLCNPGVDELPQHSLSLQGGNETFWVGARVQRDAGEPDASDLTRLTLQWKSRQTTMIVGDFKVDFGSGWTVGVTPTFPTSTDPDAPFRGFSGGMKPQQTSEEGRGWRGGAVRLALPGERAPSLNVWAGSAAYDAHEEEDGWAIYATQGDHTDEEATATNLVNERLYGSAVSFELGRVKLDAIRLVSFWDRTLSPTQQPSRFRFGGQSFGASGIALKQRSSSTNRYSVEISYQDHGAWGGGASTAIPLPESGQFVLASWRATSSFAPLHTRPWLPSGSDPAGKTGLFSAWNREFGDHLEVILGWYGNQREAMDSDSEERSQKINGICRFHPAPSLLLESVVSEKWDWQRGDTHERSRSARFHMRYRSGRNSRSLRLHISEELTGSGWGVTGSSRQSLGRLLALDLGATYLSTSGTGATIAVVEPAPLEAIPFVRLSGERMRLVMMLTFDPLPGARFWIRGRAEHRLDEGSPGNTASWDLGIRWRATYGERD